MTILEQKCVRNDIYHDSVKQFYHERTQELLVVWKRRAWKM